MCFWSWFLDRLLKLVQSHKVLLSKNLEEVNPRRFHIFKYYWTMSIERWCFAAQILKIRQWISQRLCWFNFILGFNSTLLSGLDMVFSKNGFEKNLKKISINIESLQQDIYWGTSRCYELSFRQRDIQCATCEKRTNLSLPASFQKIMLAFIREPDVFNKTIIPVARCTSLARHFLNERYWQYCTVLCNNLT